MAEAEEKVGRRKCYIVHCGRKDASRAYWVDSFQSNGAAHENPPQSYIQGPGKGTCSQTVVVLAPLALSFLSLSDVCDDCQQSLSRRAVLNSCHLEWVWMPLLARWTNDQAAKMGPEKTGFLGNIAATEGSSTAHRRDSFWVCLRWHSFKGLLFWKAGSAWLTCGRTLWAFFCN